MWGRLCWHIGCIGRLKLLSHLNWHERENIFISFLFLFTLWLTLASIYNQIIYIFFKSKNEQIVVYHVKFLYIFCTQFERLLPMVEKKENKKLKKKRWIVPLFYISSTTNLIECERRLKMGNVEKFKFDTHFWIEFSFLYSKKGRKEKNQIFAIKRTSNTNVSVSTFKRLLRNHCIFIQNVHAFEKTNLFHFYWCCFYY